MIYQLLDGCVKQQRASGHDEAFSTQTIDFVTSEEIPIEFHGQTLDQTCKAEISPHYHSPSFAHGQSADANDRSPFECILHDAEFVRRCAHSENGLAAADATLEEDADPFHDDWPYWDQASSTHHRRGMV